MRRAIARLLAATTLATLTLGVVPQGHKAQAQSHQPPHAWLFGAWTGGLFPVPSGLTAEACLAQPVVIFTRDVVLRATLTEVTYTQRVIATVRSTAQGFEFRFDPTATSNGRDTLLGLTTPPQAAGFGCDSPDELHVQRQGENQITFPGCSEFPNPLVRCPAR